MLVIPLASGSLRSRAIGGEIAQITGRWARTPDGYRITLQLAHSIMAKCWPGARLGFDLLINEMRPQRVRRAGQLVWSGGNGWIYLRGDRQDASSFGILNLGAT